LASWFDAGRVPAFRRRGRKGEFRLDLQGAPVLDWHTE
jgi:hypothetical protein